MSNSVLSNGSEIAFLSLLLKHPELIHDTPDIRVGMFSSTPHQVIYATLTELSAQSSIPEQEFLLEYLRSKNKLSLAGGEGQIKYLFEQDFKIENFHNYKSLILGAYRTRVAMSTTHEAHTQLIDGQDVDTVLFNLQTQLETLNASDSRNSTFRLSDSLSGVWEEISSRIKNPGLTGISTGYDSLDAITGGYPAGDFWIIGARPSQGKTALVCNSILKSSQRGGVPLIFSLEMNTQTFVERFLSILSGVSLSDIRLGTMNQEEIDKVHDVFPLLKSLPIFVDTSFAIDSSYVTSVIRKYVKNFGVNMVWIDYIQLMSVRNDDQTAELGRISRALKLLAKNENVFIGAVAQLNRLVEMRDDKRPILSDLRQSGNLEEDADLVAFLYRDDYYYSDSSNKNILEYIIRKHRNGPVGMTPLKFSKETTLITDV